MECAMCGGTLVRKKGVIEFNSRIVGGIWVPGLEFLECGGCGDRLLSLEMSDKAIDYVEKKEQQAIDLLPVKEFVSAKDAARILGITKQAFSKHPKVKRGLILSTTIDNRRYYLRKSVDLFKEKGNGKFLIANPRTRRPRKKILSLKHAAATDVKSKYNYTDKESIGSIPIEIIAESMKSKTRIRNRYVR